MKGKKINAGKKLNGNVHELSSLRNDPHQREQMIAVAAYFRAEKRDFAPNKEMADWLESEREIDGQLNSSSSQSIS